MCVFVCSQSAKLEYEDEDRSDTEEEKPVVVVLKDGDLTAEEAGQIKEQTKDTEDDGSNLGHNHTCKTSKTSLCSLLQLI